MCHVSSPPKSDFLSSLFPKLLQDLYHKDESIQLEATNAFVAEICTRPTQFIELIKRGIIPAFVHVLENASLPTLQYSSTWILTNVATWRTGKTQALIDAGAVTVWVHLLASPNEMISEQSIRALRNIAIESSTFRDIVLDSNVLSPLLR